MGQALENHPLPQSIMPPASVNNTPSILVEQPDQLPSPEDLNLLPKTAAVRIKRSFVVLSFLTLITILSSIGLLIYLSWPKINNFFRNSGENYSRQFEDVISNSLRTENQTITFNLIDNDIVEVVPKFNQAEITKASIEIDNELKLQYFDKPINNQTESEMDFDLIINEGNDSSRISLKITVIFQNEKDLFLKIKEYTIDNKEILNASDINRWTKLNDLSNIENLQSENISHALQYISTFLNNYNPYEYITLMPLMNISDSKSFSQAETTFKNSSAYNIDEDSCKLFLGSKKQCQLTIDYKALYKTYQKIYKEVFNTPLPQYYNYLNNKNKQLEKFTIIFDADHEELVQITNIDFIENEDNEEVIDINFTSFNETDFSLNQATDILDIVEYNRKILEIEDE